MYKLARWLYDLGRKHEYDTLRNELFILASRRPERFDDPEFGMQEDEKHFSKRIDDWFTIQKFVEAFYEAKERDDSDVL